ncbi:MAG: DapH/DapD/GlmU-related protein [bacterium]|nr:DapH/DapD/GlmU-related protein [bacterium]
MSGNLELKAEKQKSMGDTSWTLREAVIVRLWEIVWCLLLQWTPKKLNGFRLFCLKLFGAKIHGHPFVFPSAKIYAPFNLELFDHACIGPAVNVYNLGKTVLMENSTVSQETMLCGGTHDLSSPRLPLMVGSIEIGHDVFIGVRALILPGLRIGDGSVVGAAALVTKNVPEWTIVAGNPAHEIGKRNRLDD